MPIRFVAIVNAQNEPVYFRSAGDVPRELEINHQFIAEMSLDFVEQQAAHLQASLRKPLLVVLHDGIAVYAMLSNTRHVYLMGADSAVEPTDVEEAVQLVVDEFVAYQCNPFRAKAARVQSPQFDTRIAKIIAAPGR